MMAKSERESRASELGGSRMTGYGNHNTRCFHAAGPATTPIREETFEAMVDTCRAYPMRLEVGRR